MEGGILSIWKYLPRSVRVSLLDQPVPETWKKSIETSMTLSETEAIQEKLNLSYKRDYSMIAALVILVVSGFIVFVIIN